MVSPERKNAFDESGFLKRDDHLANRRATKAESACDGRLIRHDGRSEIPNEENVEEVDARRRQIVSGRDGTEHFQRRVMRPFENEREVVHSRLQSTARATFAEHARTDTRAGDGRSDSASRDRAELSGER
ncbi:MAG: hypothetical protein ABI183_18125, partial [Polyangiaceae bacterium]